MSTLSLKAGLMQLPIYFICTVRAISPNNLGAKIFAILKKNDINHKFVVISLLLGNPHGTYGVKIC